jgi:hypothetical protein
MTLNSIRQAGVSAATLALCCIALANVPSVHAQEKMTAQSLIDRQMILDQIQRRQMQQERQQNLRDRTQQQLQKRNN